MKQIIFIIIFFLGGIIHKVEADTIQDEIIFENFKCVRIDNKIYISFDANLKELKLKCEEEQIFTPVIYTQTESCAFPEFRIAGRYRYFRHLRQHNLPDGSTMYRYGKEDIIHYEAHVPYYHWMETSRIAVLDNRCGCLCRVKSSEHSRNLAVVDFRSPVFVPDYFYIEPQEKEVVLEACGSAFIDFVVNRTEIREDYRNNTRELNKITVTVDSIKADPDVHITSLKVKGFASPEGSYTNNTRLARERTIALKEYLNARYAFPAHIMKTDYEPEDWTGLAKLLAETNLQHRDAILKLIADATLKPDTKEQLIRNRYPEDYRYIQSHIYPALRHSDYIVTYKVKNYTDIDEAKRVLKIKPGKLSEHEFYMIAQSYNPGSE